MVSRILRLILITMIIPVMSAIALLSAHSTAQAGKSVTLSAIATDREMSADKRPTFITYAPAEIQDILYNPYMGWMPWANSGPYPQHHTLVYACASWRELEPEKGNISFNRFETDNRFSYWSSKGIKIVIRLTLDYPGSKKHMDIPDWLYRELNGDGSWYNLDDQEGFSPNYSNPLLISYHKKLIEALAKRYDNDPRIYCIQLGSLGHWGEWHTRNDSKVKIPFPDVSVSNQYVTHYLDSFRNKFLIMRRPFQIAKDNKMGLFNDSFGNVKQTSDYFINWFTNGYVDYLTGVEQPSMPDFWKNAPSGGEFADYPGLMYLYDDRINTTIQQVKDSHISWLGPCCPISQHAGSELQKNIDLMMKTMGYRFVLQSTSYTGNVMPGDTVTVSMDWVNKGVAPFYFQWPVELSLADLNGKIAVKTLLDDDIRSWLPGQRTITHNFSIPADLPCGTYTLCVAILDPETGAPGLNLAIDRRRQDGRYQLGKLAVLLPSPWTFDDVGSPGITGSVLYRNGEFTIAGAGADIWSKSDEFSYVYRSTSGNCSFSARVLSQTNTNEWAKAGLMFRESPDAGSRYVDLFISPSFGLVMQWRDENGGTCGNIVLKKSIKLPVYIRLARRGNTFYAYRSSDGIRWGLPLCKHTVKMDKQAAAGMCVTSHNIFAASYARMDRVMISK